MALDLAGLLVRHVPLPAYDFDLGNGFDATGNYFGSYWTSKRAVIPLSLDHVLNSVQAIVGTSGATSEV